MSSSLSSFFRPSSCGTSSSTLLCKKKAACVKSRRASLRVQAAAKEDASNTEKGSVETAQASDPALRSAKGFGPRPPPPPPKPAKPTPSSFTKDRKSVTSRRPAPNRNVILPVADPVVRERDKVFIVGLSIVGVFIFIEGIAVAASGFLPDEWDAFVVKYVYPAFTPTVGIFLAGAVLFGVFKVTQPDKESDASN